MEILTIILAIVCIVFIYFYLRQKMSVSEETKRVAEEMMQIAMTKGDLEAYRRFARIFRSFE